MRIIIRLELINGQIQELELSKSSYKLGRSESCDIVLPFNYISSIACTLILYHDPIGYLIRDGALLGRFSRSGIRINGERKIRHRLQNGDVVSLHQVIKTPRFIYIQENDREEELPTEEFKSL